MRINLEKTIGKEKAKAAEEERANNMKEFERIYELEDKLRLAEVSNLFAGLVAYFKMKLSEAEDTVEYQNRKISELSKILEENNVDTRQFFHNLKEQKDIEKRKKDRITELTRDYNKISDDLQKCLAQNALLRQMAKVPDNFGENVDDMLINTDGNINNYKRKIKFLELELEQAEAQRAEF